MTTARIRLATWLAFGTALSWGCSGAQAPSPDRSALSAETGTTVSADQSKAFAADPDAYRGWAPRWFGVPTLQNAYDLVILEELINEVEPAYLIEAGTFLGGSALYYATVMDQILPDSKVITLDIDDVRAIPDHWEHLQSIPAWKRHVEFLWGSSIDPAIVKQIGDRVRGQAVMVVLDSNHEASHVARELEAYAPMVSVGSYLVVQDTYIEEWWGVKEPPIVAVRAFLATHPEFQIDKTRERFHDTNSKDGFLRRTR